MAQPAAAPLFLKSGPLPPLTFELGEDFYANVFLDEYISIRKYIRYISPKMYPTGEGILLNDEQWNGLASNSRRITSALKKKMAETIFQLPPLTIGTTVNQQVRFQVLNKEDVLLSKSQWDALAGKIPQLSGIFNKKNKRLSEGDPPVPEKKMKEEEFFTVDEWDGPSQPY